MTLIEERDVLEAAKHQLWKPIFKGKKNRKALADIDYINDQIHKINQVLYPRRPKS